VQPAADQHGQRPGGGRGLGHPRHCMFGLPLDEEAGYHVPMTLRDAFPEITRPNEPLAPFTSLLVGGAAEFFVRPRSVAELVGGAVRANAGDRSGEIGQYVRRVQVLDARGSAIWREHDELRFGEQQSNLDDPVILSAEFELETDRPDVLMKRLLKAWIVRKARLPHSFEAAA